MGLRAAYHLALLTAFVPAAPALGQAPGERVPLPSGQEVRFVEARRDETGVGGVTWRFRFLAPAIARAGGSVDFETAAADMEYLCQRFVLPRLPEGEAVGQIVISLADREVEFGQPAPEATQYFEAFVLENGDCVWEGF